MDPTPGVWRPIPRSGPETTWPRSRPRPTRRSPAGPEWSHFAAQIKGRFLDASNPWACFGLRPKLGDRSFYVFEVRGKQSRLSVWKQWQGGRDPTVAREVPLGRVEPGRWYTLRTELVGDRIRVDFDGRRVLELIDPRPIPSGRIAISASYGTVQLDDFREEEIPSSHLFAAQDKPAKPYDPGPILERPAATGPSDAAYWYLQRPGLRAAVHRRTGMLGGLWLGDGRPCARSSGARLSVPDAELRDSGRRICRRGRRAGPQSRATSCS